MQSRATKYSFSNRYVMALFYHLSKSFKDTVMGIQALSAIASFFAERSTDLTLNVAHSGDESFSLQFNINKENSIVLQTADVMS